MVILSHGEQNDFVYGKNGNSVQVDDLIEPFRGSNCPGLGGKPKVFIVNACSGCGDKKMLKFLNFILI